MIYVLIILGLVFLFLICQAGFEMLYYNNHKKEIDKYFYMRALEHKKKIEELRKTYKDERLLDILEKENNKTINEYLNEYKNE